MFLTGTVVETCMKELLEKNLYSLKFVLISIGPKRHISVKTVPWSLKFVFDWFLMQQFVQLRHNNNDNSLNDKLLNLYNSCKQRKTNR